MTNDLRCCDDSKTMLEGSRGGSASLPTHSTSPFQSPRGRMSVASSHVPHPRPCGPRSCWDRCTILHIRGAAGPQRRPSHRTAPPKRCTMSIMKCRLYSIDFYPGGFASLRARTRDAAVPGLGAALGLWTMSRLGPGCESLGKDHRSKASNLVRVGAARGRRERPLTVGGDRRGAQLSSRGRLGG